MTRRKCPRSAQIRVYASVIEARYGPAPDNGKGAAPTLRGSRLIGLDTTDAQRLIGGISPDVQRIKMEITLLLSLWGAALSTVLAVLAIVDRTRARPIIRTHAKIQISNVRERSKFTTASFKTGRYDDSVVQEIFVEFRAENHGNKPLSLQHVYIEDGNGNLNYITPEGLPLILEGQSSSKFDIQKEYFDAIDIPTRQRVIGDVIEIGFVDALDRRYPVSKKELDLILRESLSLPTTRAVYVRKEYPEDLVVAFQGVHEAILTRRSRTANHLSRKLPFGLDALTKLWGAE